MNILVSNVAAAPLKEQSVDKSERLKAQGTGFRKVFNTGGGDRERREGRLVGG